MKIRTCTLLSTFLTFFNYVQSLPRPSNQDEGYGFGQQPYFNDRSKLPIRLDTTGSSTGSSYLYGSPHHLGTLGNGQDPIGTPLPKSNAGSRTGQSSQYGNPYLTAFQQPYLPGIGMHGYQPNAGYGLQSSSPHGSPDFGTFHHYQSATTIPGYHGTIGSSTGLSHLHGSPTKLGTLRNVQEPIGTPVRKSNAGTNQGSNVAQKEYEKPPKAVMLRGEWWSVAGVKGKYYFKWFLPQHPSQVVHLAPARADWMKIRILTQESISAGPIEIKDADLLFREAENIAKCHRRKKTVGKWVLLGTTIEGGDALEATPIEFDILVRNRMPHAQYQNGFFYAYDPKPKKLPPPAASSVSWRIKQ